jgi:hypothetical protein
VAILVKHGTNSYCTELALALTKDRKNGIANLGVALKKANLFKAKLTVVLEAKV